MFGKKYLSKLLEKPINELLYITYLFYIEKEKEKEKSVLTYEEYSQLILKRMKTQ